MKNSYKYSLLAGLVAANLGFPLPQAQAQLSVISVQELAQLQAVLVEAKATAETATEIFEEARKTANSLEGNLNVGRGIQGKISRLRRGVENSSVVFSQLPLEGNIDIEDVDFSNPEEIIEVLTDQFDRDIGMKQMEVYRASQAKAKDAALKDAIVDSQRIIGEIPENLNTLSALAAEVDRTQTQKEATDLNNRLLLEILSIQTQQLELLARIARAEQLAAYTGENTDDLPNEGDSASRVHQDSKGGDWFPGTAFGLGESEKGASHDMGL